MKNSFISLYNLSETLTVLSGLKKDDVLDNLCKILEIFSRKDFKERIYPEATEYYANMCSALYKADKSAGLPNYLYDLILYDENVFSLACSRGKFHEISTHIIEAVKNDIKTLRLLSEIDYDDIVGMLIKNNPELEKVADSMPSYANTFKYYGKKDVWKIISLIM